MLAANVMALTKLSSAPRSGRTNSGFSAMLPASFTVPSSGSVIEASWIRLAVIVSRVSLSAVITALPWVHVSFPPERYERSRGLASPEGAHAGGILVAASGTTVPGRFDGSWVKKRPSTGSSVQAMVL